jgi:5-methylcytosine-specific restriction enzyme subunit McrC
MRLVTAFEHGWLEIGEGRELSLHEAESLAAAESQLPGGCLQWGYRRVKFAQFCGVVQIKGLQIEILPKLYPLQSEAQQRSTLLTMLSHAGDLEGLETLSAGLSTNHTTLLDLFIRHFARLLEHQLQQGLLRDYLDIDDTLDQVRGRIDLIRQQRENLFKPQRLACRFSERVADIPVNRLLHTALQLVATLTTSPLLYQQLHALRMRFAEIGTLSRHERGPETSQLNRMQLRYAAATELAHLFLDGQFLDARSGRQQAFSLLFDMNRLFERYTANRLRPLARRHGLRLVEQGPKRHLGHDANGKGRLLMRPDISLLGSNKNPMAILDTKWKHLEDQDPLKSLSPADLYQINAYSTAYGCAAVGLLYPEQLHLPAGRAHVLTLTGSQSARLTLQAIPLDGRQLSDDLIGQNTPSGLGIAL